MTVFLQNDSTQFLFYLSPSFPYFFLLIPFSLCSLCYRMLYIYRMDLMNVCLYSIKILKIKMIPIVFLFYKTKTFKDYHSYEKVHEKWIKIDLEK